MKRITIFTIVLNFVCGLFISSCQHTDLKENIIGNWMDVYEYHEYPKKDRIDREEMRYTSIYTFESDGSFVNKFENGAYQDGKWSLNGKEITLIYERLVDKNGNLVEEWDNYRGKGNVEIINDSEMTFDLKMTYKSDKAYYKIKYIRQ